MMLVAYFVGSLPIGYWFVKYYKQKNICSFGSGTMGATNVGRLCGFFSFVLIAFLDGLKAFVVLALFDMFYSPAILLNLWLGVCVVLGNVFSFGASFPVGKGVATLLGLLSFINGWLAFLFAVVWGGVIILLRVPTLASFSALCVVTVLSFYLGCNYQFLLFLLSNFLILLYSHRNFYLQA